MTERAAGQLAGQPLSGIPGQGWAKWYAASSASYRKGATICSTLHTHDRSSAPHPLRTTCWSVSSALYNMHTSGKDVARAARGTRLAPAPGPGGNKPAEPGRRTRR